MQAAVQATRDPAPSNDLATVFEKHHEDVFRAAYRITGNAMDAEDALQTVFLRLLRREDAPTLSENAGSYLRRAAVNASLDLIRRRKVQASVSLEAVERAADPGPGPDSRQREDELRSSVRKALAAMNPRAAEMFALRYFEGYGNREIATMLNTSWSTVAVTLHRARARLRQSMAASLEGVRP